jgi:hypothetical protein
LKLISIWSLKFSSSLGDPEYNAVPITSCEAEILKQPMLSRLKQVEELGPVYLSYTGGITQDSDGQLVEEVRGFMNRARRKQGDAHGARAS